MRGRMLVSAIVLGMALFGYASLAHWAAVSQTGVLGVLVALTPVFALSAVVAARAWGMRGLAAAAASAAMLGLLALRSNAADLRLLYPVPNISMNLCLFWLFARTLRPGREAIVTRMARHVHGTLPPDIEAHTRHVTWAWSVFFAVMAAASVLLFSFASLATWSVFANVLTLPLAILFFVAEYAYRLWRYPNFSHASLLTGVSAFRRVKRATLLHGR